MFNGCNKTQKYGMDLFRTRGARQEKAFYIDSFPNLVQLYLNTYKNMAI